MVAAVILAANVSAARGDDVCLTVGLTTARPTDDVKGMAVMAILLLFLILSIAANLYLWTRSRQQHRDSAVREFELRKRLDKRAKNRPELAKTGSRTIACQAMCMYQRKAANPRFHVLPETSAGCSW